MLVDCHVYAGSLASSLKDVLEQASSVDLFHLTTILEKLLSDPARVISVKRNLRMVQTVSFMDLSVIWGHRSRRRLGYLAALSRKVKPGALRFQAASISKPGIGSVLRISTW